MLKCRLKKKFTFSKKLSTRFFKYVGEVPECSYGWSMLSRNWDVPLDFIKACVDSPLLNWYELSGSPHLTPEFIKTHINKPWNWRKLSRNRHITPEFVEAYINKPWNWYKLSENPIITPEFVEAHLDKFKLCWRKLSRNTSMTLEFIEAHLDEEWDWSALSNHPKITVKFVELHIDKPWRWVILYLNLNFSLDFIYSHPDKFGYASVSN